MDTGNAGYNWNNDKKSLKDVLSYGVYIFYKCALYVTFVHRNINISLLDGPTNLILTLQTCMNVHINLPVIFYSQVVGFTPAAI
jgi:hypothetical protein